MKVVKTVMVELGVSQPRYLFIKKIVIAVRLLHTEFKQSNFLENLPHREIEVICSRFYYDNMQDKK